MSLFSDSKDYNSIATFKASIDFCFNKKSDDCQKKLTT